MINVLNKDTNEVLGFPDTTDIHEIQNAVSDDNNGTISQAKPNWYRDKVQPALEATGMDMFQPKFLGAKIEPDATRAFATTYAKEATFGAFENNNPEVKKVNEEAQAEHPIASFSGALAGQTQSILMTAGLGGLFGLGKLAVGAEGLATSAITKGVAGSEAIQKGGEIAGKVAKAVTGNAGVGALYGLIKGGVDQWNNSVNNNDHPHLIKVGEEALKDAGVFGLYGAVGTAKSVPIATAAIAGTAYAISKAEGQSEPDALLNAGTMAAFHFISSANHPPEVNQAIIDATTKMKADYINAMNPVVNENISDRAAEEHTQNAVQEVLEKSNEAIASKPEVAVPEEPPVINKKDGEPVIPGTFKDGHAVETLDYLLNSGIPGKVVARMSGAERLDLANGDWRTLRDTAVDYEQNPWKADRQPPVLNDKSEVNPPADRVEQDAAKARGGVVSPTQEVTQSPTLMKELVGNFAKEVSDNGDGEVTTTRKGIKSVDALPEPTPTKAEPSPVRVKVSEPKAGEEVQPAQEPIPSEGKEKNSRLYERLAQQLDEENRDQPTYNQMNMKEHAQKAIDLQQSDPDLVEKVARGVEPAPEGYSETALRSAHYMAMKDAGKMDEANSAITSATLRGTRLGQEVNMYKMYGKDGSEVSPENFVKKAIQDRVRRAGKSLKKTGFGSSKDRALKEIDKQKKEVRNVLDNARVDVDEIQKVIDSIIC